MKQCVICGCAFERETKESNQNWRGRATCRSVACMAERKRIVSSGDKSSDPKHWSREIAPWPKGVRFDDNVDHPVRYARFPRPETHVPSRSSAA